MNLKIKEYNVFSLIFKRENTMKHILKGLALCAGLAAGAAWAQSRPAEPGLNYNELSVGYSLTDIKGSNDPRGPRLHAQFLVHPQWFLALDSLTTKGKKSGSTAKLSQTTGVVGWRYALGDQTDLNLTGGFMSESASTDATKWGSGDGNVFGIGLRSMLSRELEVSLGVSSLKGKNDTQRVSETSVGLGYHWSPDWVVRLGYASGDGVNTTTLSLGYKF